MPDELPTIWDGAAHTFAKHQILESYLKAWMPLMSHQAHRVGTGETSLLFVDGFAGPGRYDQGEPGSPILAVKSVLSHSHDFPIPVTFLFVEERPDRYALLGHALDEYQQEMDASPKIKTVQALQGDCETLLNSLLDDYKSQGRQLGPALFFLDQSGYSDVSMELIRGIMSYRLCEVFSYLNWDHMNRFLTDKNKWQSLSKTFGGDEWRKVLTLETSERRTFILKAYRSALEGKAGSQYVWHFAMCDANDKLLYWLFFCTNNLRGLEEMKKAMWRVDPTGGFRFSDKDDPSQLRLFQNYDPSLLAEELISTFQGKVLTLAQVKEFVLTKTPAYLYKGALKLLKDGKLLKRINPPPGRRSGTFSDEQMQVQFLSSKSTDS